MDFYNIMSSSFSQALCFPALDTGLHTVNLPLYVKRYKPKKEILRFFCFLVESSEHEEKSMGVSGEISSQPCPAPGYSQPEEAKEDMDVTKQTKPEENDDLGPLPDNWEMAYTEKGEVYFIE